VSPSTGQQKTKSAMILCFLAVIWLLGCVVNVAVGEVDHVRQHDKTKLGFVGVSEYIVIADNAPYVNKLFTAGYVAQPFLGKRQFRIDRSISEAVRHNYSGQRIIWLITRIKIFLVQFVRGKYAPKLNSEPYIGCRSFPTIDQIYSNDSIASNYPRFRHDIFNTHKCAFIKNEIVMSILPLSISDKGIYDSRQYPKQLKDKFSVFVPFFILFGSIVFYGYGLWQIDPGPYHVVGVVCFFVGVILCCYAVNKKLILIVGLR